MGKSNLLWPLLFLASGLSSSESLELILRGKSESGGEVRIGASMKFLVEKKSGMSSLTRIVDHRFISFA